MACRIENSVNEEPRHAAGWFHLPDWEAIQCENRIYDQAVHEAIRGLSKVKPGAHGFCFLRVPLGGRPIAFAW